jgi:hypothetical protein
MPSSFAAMLFPFPEARPVAMFTKSAMAFASSSPTVCGCASTIVSKAEAR